MTGWYESRIDQQIREAQERGEFDNLPGTGKPLPDHNELHDEDWWVKELMRREGLRAVLPTSLALRKEAEDLMQTISKKTTESSVREIVNDLNNRILKARRGPVDGPPVVIHTFDVEEVLQAWRELRAGEKG